MSEPNAEFLVRRMKRPDLGFAIDWANREGWNLGLHDAETFYNADPSGFYAGFIGEVPVACISSVAYDSSFGFIGLYMVKQEFRGRGFGIKIWEKALEHLGSRNIGLDGVVARKPCYEKYGFRFAYRNLRFAGRLECQQTSKNVVELKDLETSSVIEYDSQMFPARRDDFISSWIRQRECRALGHLTRERLDGYGLLRPCATGFKIGPLFADNEEIAQELLWSLASHAAEDRVFIDVPEPNQQALGLVKRNGMEKVSETARMYNRVIPELPLYRIYGVTTLELG